MGTFKHIGDGQSSDKLKFVPQLGIKKFVLFPNHPFPASYNTLINLGIFWEEIFWEEWESLIPEFPVGAAGPELSVPGISWSSCFIQLFGESFIINNLILIRFISSKCSELEAAQPRQFQTLEFSPGGQGRPWKSFLED